MGVLDDKLVMPPVLAPPKSNGKYANDADVCNRQVGSALLQEQKNKVLVPVRYWLRSLCDTEGCYDTTHKGCLGAVWSVLMLRPHLESSHFKIHTDHQTIQRIFELKKSIGRLAGWRPRLVKFDFEIAHRPGKYHEAAYAMPRLPKKKQKRKTESQTRKKIIQSTVSLYR